MHERTDEEQILRRRTQAIAMTRFAYILGGLLITATLAAVLFLAVQDHYRIEQNTKIQNAVLRYQHIIKRQAIENHETSVANRHYITAAMACYSHGVHQYPKLLMCAERKVHAE